MDVNPYKSNPIVYLSTKKMSKYAHCVHIQVVLLYFLQHCHSKFYIKRVIRWSGMHLAAMYRVSTILKL